MRKLTLLTIVISATLSGAAMAAVSEDVVEKRIFTFKAACPKDESASDAALRKQVAGLSDDQFRSAVKECLKISVGAADTPEKGRRLPRPRRLPAVAPPAPRLQEAECRMELQNGMLTWSSSGTMSGEIMGIPNSPPIRVPASGTMNVGAVQAVSGTFTDGVNVVTCSASVERQPVQAAAPQPAYQQQSEGQSAIALSVSLAVGGYSAPNSYQGCGRGCWRPVYHRPPPRPHPRCIVRDRQGNTWRYKNGQWRKDGRNGGWNPHGPRDQSRMREARKSSDVGNRRQRSDRNSWRNRGFQNRGAAGRQQFDRRQPQLSNRNGWRTRDSFRSGRYNGMGVHSPRAFVGRQFGGRPAMRMQAPRMGGGMRMGGFRGGFRGGRGGRR